MSDLLKAIAVTAELTGTEWSKEAALAVADELRGYPLADVKIALTECRKNLKGRLTLAEILDRIPSGHPGPEVAWATIAKAMGNEQLTLVWTDQMREAYGIASQLADDPVQARMAFKEAYLALVKQARQTGLKPVWSVSLGYDVKGRELAVSEAVAKGQIPYEQARKLVPMLPEPKQDVLAIMERIG